MSIGLLSVIVCGFAGGILLRSFFIFAPIVVMSLCSLFSGVALALFCLKVFSRYLCMLCVMCVCSVSCGALYFAWRDALVFEHVASISQFENKKVSFEGVVVRDVSIRERTQLLVVKTTDLETPRPLFVRVSTERGVLYRYGDHVSVSGTLMRPETFETELGRSFPYEGYLRAQGITHSMSYATVSLTSSERAGVALFRFLYDVKKVFQESLTRALPEPHAGLAAGLLIGEKRALGEDLEEAFRAVGIIHIVVLSGYNLTIVAESIMRLLSFVWYPKTRAYVGVCVIACFALMVGLSATVVRASIMASLVLVARALGRISTAIRGLLFACLCMVVWNPYVVAFDPGFQLSFLATLGLIVSERFMEKFFLWIPDVVQLRSLVSATVATQLFVTPLLAYSMGTISLIAPIANALVLFVVPLAMALSFVSGVVGVIAGGWVSIVVAYPAYIVLYYIIVTANILASVPFATLTLPTFSLWYVIGAYACLALWLWNIHKTAARP